jgi:hypothetical protein
MQLTVAKEAPMRAPSSTVPLETERRFLELDEKELIGSVEITEEEILDDLLYPADRRAQRYTGSDSWRSEAR